MSEIKTLATTKSFTDFEAALLGRRVEWITDQLDIKSNHPTKDSLLLYLLYEHLKKQKAKK